MFLSNFPESGWLSDARLRERRPDLVYVNIIGSPDGSSEVDYTVNAASGIALATGTAGSALPLNNALPAWDIATGLHAVIAMLAAERARSEGGGGQLVKIALADVAFATVANLGFLGQAEVRRVRARLAIVGRSTRDGRRDQPQPVAVARLGDGDRRSPAGDGARLRGGPLARR